MLQPRMGKNQAHVSKSRGPQVSMQRCESDACPDALPATISKPVAARRIGWISQHGKHLLHECRAAMFEAGYSE